MATMTKMTTRDQLHSALESSANQALLIFKHSTRCPISAAAYDQVLAYLKGQPNEDTDYKLIDVIADRDISNEASQALEIRHESPQVILVRDGKPVWHTSHSQITVKSLEGNVGSL
ncbi:bacillithiol system redox-active protein YtxJ [Paenibacillus lemnae]|uniref:Bacillithiol system redox-active protein YtxJ n=1 Tax=Paenibacillus lemnae TaxID=1330551 RepID=A0A848M1F1_PAELE|nr:bacillithiol system redox-active protein YtxJ [Paenibacillus lemnae]NMO94687.1 bacillithiol system redox-active protein YtxJ [Paenibacillus lemnae]